MSRLLWASGSHRRGKHEFVPASPRGRVLATHVDKLAVVVVPEQSGLRKREIRERGKEISAGSWAPEAVKKAVEAAQAGVSVAMIGGTAGATMASS